MSTAFDNKISVLILQHPQEPDKELGTARLAASLLKNAQVRVGLSWPNLSKAVHGKITDPEKQKEDPKNWGVLYLGSGIKGVNPSPEKEYLWVDKKGGPLSVEKSKAIESNLKGVIVIDGTWSQAKALWWRNAWLLKCQRLILQPKTPSLYGKLRKEPRRECVSTIETVALILSALGENDKIKPALLDAFKEHLKKF